MSILKIIYERDKISKELISKSVKSINQWQSVIQTSSDIVKAHGGELKVETKEGEGTEFIIYLPLI